MLYLKFQMMIAKKLQTQITIFHIKLMDLWFIQKQELKMWKNSTHG